MIRSFGEVVEVETLLTDVGDRALGARVDNLLRGEAGDLRLADALNGAGEVIDSNSDGVTIKTSTTDCHKLTTLCIACIVADPSDGWHNLDAVASGAIVLASLNRACVIHGVAGAPEKCGSFGC